MIYQEIWKSLAVIEKEQMEDLVGIKIDEEIDRKIEQTMSKSEEVVM